MNSRLLKAVRLLFLLTAGAAVFGHLRAQTPSVAPAQVAESYFRVLQKEDYKKAATYFDEESLKDFRARMSFFKDLPDARAQHIYPQFFGEGATKESVAALSDTDFFACWLGFFQAQARDCGKVTLDNWKYLGEVAEGTDVVHVLTRSRAQVGDQEYDGISVLSFRNVKGQWKYLIPSEMTAVPGLLKRELQVEEEAMELEASPLRVVPEKGK